MPISVEERLDTLTQAQFSDIAYEVMREAFSVHKELGSLFDEAVYRNALADRLKDVVTEVRIDVSFQEFHKVYFMDALVSGDGVFELKAVKGLSSHHRTQLLNYLFLTGLHHGKLINFGTAQVEHEFVNSKLTYADRTSFAVDDEGWAETEGFSIREKKVLLDILHDWGTGLDRSLYQEALFHVLGGVDKVLAKRNVRQRGQCIAQQTIPVCGASTGIRLTTFQDGTENYHQELVRLMRATGLTSVQWVNVARRTVTFETLHISVPHISVTKEG